MGTVFKNIWKWVAGFGTFASILGVILIFTRNETAIIIALFFVCLMLLVIMSYLLYVLHTFIRQSNQKNYSTIASFAEFRSDNGRARELYFLKSLTDLNGVAANIQSLVPTVRMYLNQYSRPQKKNGIRSL